MNLFIYIVESTICLSILYGFYKYIFYRFTYFEWNRFYLLISIVISFVIPFLHFKSLQIEIADNSLLKQNNLVFYLSEGQNFVNLNESRWQIWLNKLKTNEYVSIFNLFLIIYISGIIRYSFKFIRTLISINRLIKKSKVIDYKNYKLVKTKVNLPAFSFIKHIFVSKKFEELNKNEQKQIIEHEIIHLKQFHAVDNIIFELVSIVFWFNPLMKKLKNSVKEIHEYIVDNVLSQKSGDHNYSELMIRLSGKTKATVANAYKPKQVTNRISLLFNKEPEKIRKMRFILSFPVWFLMIFSYLLLINTFNGFINPTYASQYQFPIKDKYTIKADYFENKIVKSKMHHNEKYEISHLEITIETADSSFVYPISEGVIEDIIIVDNWGQDEIHITIKHNDSISSKYKGLYKNYVEIGAKVTKQNPIGITGDHRFYPAINFQIKKNGKPINPIKYINY